MRGPRALHASQEPAEGSLVLYKGRPACVQRVGEKVDLLLPQGEAAHVRLKDVIVLHPGPLADLAALEAPLDRRPFQGSAPATSAGRAGVREGSPAGSGPGRDEDRRGWDAEVQAAWEILAGETTNLAELAELIYGAYTPASAWAAWELLVDGLYFRGTPGEVAVATSEELAARQGGPRWRRPSSTVPGRSSCSTPAPAGWPRKTRAILQRWRPWPWAVAPIAGFSRRLT